MLLGVMPDLSSVIATPRWSGGGRMQVGSPTEPGMDKVNRCSHWASYVGRPLTLTAGLVSTTLSRGSFSHEARVNRSTCTVLKQCQYSPERVGLARVNPRGGPASPTLPSPNWV